MQRRNQNQMTKQKKKRSSTKKTTRSKKTVTKKKKTVKKKHIQKSQAKKSNSPKKKAVKAHTKRKYTPSLTDTKIKKLLTISHIEELYFLLNTLSDTDIERFIKHYQASEIAHAKEPRVDAMVSQAENSHMLRKQVQKELATQLLEEYETIKGDISTYRKNGIDTYLESLKLMSVPLKVKMFTATTSKEDFYKVKKILETVKTTIAGHKETILKLEEEKKAREKKREEEAAATKARREAQKAEIYKERENSTETGAKPLPQEPKTVEQKEQQKTQPNNNTTKKKNTNPTKKSVLKKVKRTLFKKKTKK